MVVTDLAQSPDLEVLSTDRLYQILSALKHQNDTVISFDTVQELARRAGVKHVLVGNYVKAGDAIRINITLQEAESGKIVSADRVEAANESSLFLDRRRPDAARQGEVLLDGSRGSQRTAPAGARRRARGPVVDGWLLSRAFGGHDVLARRVPLLRPGHRSAPARSGARRRASAQESHRDRSEVCARHDQAGGHREQPRSWPRT